MDPLSGFIGSLIWWILFFYLLMGASDSISPIADC